MAYTNLLGLRTELLARGFDYLSPTRANQFLNDSQNEICDHTNWPFLETSATGNSPLTIADLGRIRTVQDNNSLALERVEPDHIIAIGGDLATTGTPIYYYVTAGSAVTVYPVTVISLTVRYYKIPTELSADTDVPTVPSRFRPLIVDKAAALAYREDDKQDLSVAAETKLEENLAKMRAALCQAQPYILRKGNDY